MSLDLPIAKQREIPLQPQASSYSFMADSKNTNGKDEEEQVDERKYFQKVLKDVVALNSLFTVAVFVGLSLAQPGQVQSLQDETTCHPDAKIRKRLVSFEIASFSCFICSGFLAKTVMVFLYIDKNQDRDAKNLHRQLKYLVGFYLSIYVSMVGCLLLLLAMVDVIQIKLGRLSCHSRFTVGTVSVMVGTIGLSLVIYFMSVTYGVVVTFKAVEKGKGGPVSKDDNKV